MSAYNNPLVLVSTADAIYRQAISIVAETQRASISLVQRRLKLGFSTAREIMRRMELEGIVSAPDFEGRRSVFIRRHSLANHEREKLNHARLGVTRGAWQTHAAWGSSSSTPALISDIRGAVTAFCTAPLMNQRRADSNLRLEISGRNIVDVQTFRAIADDARRQIKDRATVEVESKTDGFATRTEGKAWHWRVTVTINGAAGSIELISTY